MDEIMRRASDALAMPVQRGGLSRREARDLQHAVDQQAAIGIVRAAQAQADAFATHARMEAAAFVTQTGLSRVAALSAEEARLVRQSPHAASRLQAVVDTYAGLVALEVTKLGQR